MKKKSYIYIFFNKSEFVADYNLFTSTTQIQYRFKGGHYSKETKIKLYCSQNGAILLYSYFLLNLIFKPLPNKLEEIRYYYLTHFKI